MKLFRKSITALTALFVGGVTVFSVTSCSNNVGEQALQKLSLLLDEKTEESLTGDLDVPYSIKVDNKEYVVSYSTDSENAKVVSSEESKTTVVEIEQTGKEQSFALTAEVEKKSKKWDFKIAAKDVSMLKTQAEVNAMADLKTYEQYAQLSSGVKVVVQGWVTWAHDFSSSYGNASVWLQDENGGYYAYRVKVNNQEDFDTYFKTGKKIAIEGTTSPYNGWMEIGSGCTYYSITDAEEKTFDYKDITASVSGKKATDAGVKAFQNQKVKVTGAKVTSLPTYSSSQMTMGISIGGEEYSVFFKSNYMGSIPSSILDDLEIGYTINVSGFTSISNNALQICPVDAKSIEVTSRTVTDQDRVNGAVADVQNQNINSVYYDSLSQPVTLLTETENGCTVEYALSEVKGTAITLANNQFNVTVDYAAASSATLTATITKGEAEAKTVEWKISTKTDKDVFDSLKKAVQNQEITLLYDESGVGSRTRFETITSPSKTAATISYALKDEADQTYITVGQTLNTKQWYFDVKSVPQTGSKEVVINATLSYKDTTETIAIKVALQKELTPFDSYFYAEEGADLGSVTGVVTWVGNYSYKYSDRTKQNYAGLAIEGGTIYVFTSKIEMADWNKIFAVGNKVTIKKGTKDIYNSLHEYVVSSISDCSLVEAAAEDYQVSYQDISSLVASEENLTTNAFVRLQATTVSVTGTVVKSGNNYYVQVADGKKIQIYSDKPFVQNADGINLSTLMTAGETVTVNGFLGWYSGAQIYITGAASVVKGTN